MKPAKQRVAEWRARQPKTERACGFCGARFVPSLRARVNCGPDCSIAAKALATRRHAERNPGYMTVLAQKYRKLHPERYRVALNNARARRRLAPGPGVTVDEWVQVLEAFGRRCAYCLQPHSALTRDHIEPLARGGADAPDNVVPACLPCNSRKQASTLLRFVQRGGATCR